MRTIEPDSKGSNPHPATLELCDVGQVTQLSLSLNVFNLETDKHRSSHVIGLSYRLNESLQVKCVEYCLHRLSVRLSVCYVSFNVSCPETRPAISPVAHVEGQLFYATWDDNWTVKDFLKDKVLFYLTGSLGICSGRSCGSCLGTWLPLTSGPRGPHSSQTTAPVLNEHQS